MALFSRLAGKDADAPHDLADNWRESELMRVLHKYRPEDTFIADETALFYELLRQKTLCEKTDRCKWAKKSKQRLTVLLCCNAAGTEKLKLLNLTNRLAGLGLEGGGSEHGSSFQPSISMPRFMGYDDRKTVADFLSDLNVYKTASGASDEFVLTRVLPVALEASAGRWWRLQTPFASWADFEARFREEFLPPDYDYRIRRELEARTQHPREGLLEYIPATQELFKRAIPGASDTEMVKHVLRRCHPRFRPFLHGRDYSSLEEMARSARAIEDALISELSYIPPPPVGEALEPACAWRDTYETSPQRSPQPRTAAAGLNSPRARGPSALGDRQLERGRPLDGAAHGGNSPQRLEPGFLRWENRPSSLNPFWHSLLLRPHSPPTRLEDFPHCHIHMCVVHDPVAS
ncbi:uncharacterized protein LOC144164929 [Haemaphysalis longicornis]